MKDILVTLALALSFLAAAAIGAAGVWAILNAVDERNADRRAFGNRTVRDIRHWKASDEMRQAIKAEATGR